MTRSQRKQRQFVSTHTKQIENCTLTRDEYNKLGYTEKTKYPSQLFELFGESTKSRN